MFKNLAQLEGSMRRAASVILFWILGAAVLGIVLPPSQLKLDCITLFIWGFNLPAAWLLSKSAKQMGRNAWYFGLTSLIPLLAAANFFLLYTSPEAAPRKEV